MTIYRLTKSAYADSAFRGSRRRGRWHSQGIPMVYASDMPATALLETLVHIDRAELLQMSFVVFQIEIDPDRHLLHLPPEGLPEDWSAWPWPSSTQEIGSYWFDTRSSVVLEVPCAVLPYQRNYLINTRHPDFPELEIRGPEDFPVDARLGTAGTAEAVRRQA